MAQIDPDTSQWHLDKRVPVALIVTLFVQFGAGVWFVSQLSARIEQQGRDISRLDASTAAIIGDRDDIKGRVIRIEERLQNQTDILKRIEQAVAPGSR